MICVNQKNIGRVVLIEGVASTKCKIGSQHDGLNDGQTIMNPIK